MSKSDTEVAAVAVCLIMHMCTNAHANSFRAASKMHENNFRVRMLLLLLRNCAIVISPHSRWAFAYTCPIFCGAFLWGKLLHSAS